ncbi:hypothetical protein [Companilactobacillus hulinensis]|uniref:hypothetical protein n=1 Tax=Companilactobacillus hulinensis TaxID=2486007 RepID=UPI000F7B1573|nr:hypothetical protein [Companilactobacillus hulinensis]
MTSFGSLFKVMFKDKFRSMNFILMLNVIAIVVSIAWDAIQEGLNPTAPLAIAMGWSMLALLMAFVQLSISQERKYTRDSYRLIPTSNTKFYLANMVSSLASYFYVLVVEVVFYFATALFDWSYYMKNLQAMSIVNGRAIFDAPNAITGSSVLLAVSLTSLILAWTTINLIHMASSAATNFLPLTGRKFLSAVIYVVVTWVVLQFVGVLSGSANDALNIIFNGTYTANFFIVWLIMAVIILIEAAASVYLMSRWVETITE